jgi:hypothetical protein
VAGSTEKSRARHRDIEETLIFRRNEPLAAPAPNRTEVFKLAKILTSVFWVDI